MNRTNEPRMRDVGVVGLVKDSWNAPWMARHQVLSRLAKYFQVVWLEPAPHWGEVWGRDGTVTWQSGISREKGGLLVYRPERWLAKVFRPTFLAMWIKKMRVRRAIRILRARGCTTVILYIWRPFFAYALDVEGGDASCYHMCDEYTFSDVEKPTSALERKLIRAVDQVFVHSPALLEKKGQLNPHTLLVPNGVDFQAFSTRQPEPSDLADVPHPRIGYVGHIKKHLDVEMLTALAKEHKGWSFVFVGPTAYLGDMEGHYERLCKLENVYDLGGKPVASLPGYVQYIDVCTMCYKANDYTKFIFPLKLHEYLAAGRPVVGTRIESLEMFSDVISVVRTKGEWSRAIEAALMPKARAADAVLARQQVAEGFDWNTLVYRIAREICERLGPDRLRQLDASAPPPSGVSAVAGSGLKLL